jgi:hypothetical protein
VPAALLLEEELPQALRISASASPLTAPLAREGQIVGILMAPVLSACLRSSVPTRAAADRPSPLMTVTRDRSFPRHARRLLRLCERQPGVGERARPGRAPRPRCIPQLAFA